MGESPPESVVWDKVGETVEKNGAVDKLRRPSDVARDGEGPVFYSPHYYENAEYESWKHLEAGERYIVAADPDASDTVISAFRGE